MLFPEPESKGSPEGHATTDPDEVAAADNAGPSDVATEVESLLRKGELKQAEDVILAALQRPDKTWEHYVSETVVCTAALPIRGVPLPEG